MVMIQPLFRAVQIANSATIYYTAAIRTLIDAMTVANPSNSTPYNVTIYWVVGAGAPSAANQIAPSRALQPGETWTVWPFIGQTLAVGDTIQALASSAAELNFFASGRLMTP